MIKGIGLTKKFGDNVLFENFSFSINKGDFVCFSGKSGSGKSTLLNIIGLIEPYDEGKLIIDGMTYKTNKERMEYFRSKVGFVFQNFALIDNKTVRENLELIKFKFRTDYSVEDVLDKVGLKGKLNSKVYTLSGGEQQRIALARLFLKKCDIILADEPTGSLDSENAEVVMNILQELNELGKTLVLVTHDDKIKKMADKVYAL